MTASRLQPIIPKTKPAIARPAGRMFLDLHPKTMAITPISKPILAMTQPQKGKKMPKGIAKALKEVETMPQTREAIDCP